MVNGNVYQQRFAPPAVRPQMGKVADLGVIDWALLGGGAIVAGSGLNSFIRGLPSRKKKADAVGLLVGAVVGLVGGTVFVQKFNVLTS